MENSAVTYKCPNCGGELLWDAKKRLFVCGWCSSDFTEEQADDFKTESSAANEMQSEEKERFANDTDVYICASCGAEIFCDHNTAASFCYYCHNPVTLKGRLSGEYRPDMIIPFQMDRQMAEAAFKSHCRRKWFLPSDFTSASRLEKITGLYVPFWLTDCNVDASITAKGEEVIVRRWGDTTEKITNVYQVERAAKMEYKGIPADGSKKIEDTLMDAIEPFDYSKLTDFDMAYLSGFYCDKYDVDRYDIFPRIKARIEKNTEQVLKDDIRRFQSVAVQKKDVRITDTKWHYMMLPVWFLTYNHRGKIYSFAMNGQTGKFAGIFPVSRIKAVLFSLGIGIATALLAYAIGGGVL